MSAATGVAQNVLDQLGRNGPRLSVGILSADLLRLGSELRLPEELGIPLVHVDVMDGVFAPP